MKQLRKGTLLLAGALLLAGCTITPAVPEEGAGPAATATGEMGTGDGGAGGVLTDTMTAGSADSNAAAPVTGTQGTAVMTDATGGVTMTTTVVTTTVTTVTADAALTGTAELTGTEELTGTAGNAGTDAGAAAALPTPTAVGSTEAGSTNGAAGAVGAADALTVTTPVSTPVAAGAAATSATTATATTATGTTTATGVLTDASAGTILQVINTTPGLETLAAALTASGMATALDQPGPLTFFAPTNEAFAALPEGQLDALLADPGTLAPILQYHIVIDNVAASRLGTLGAALSSSGQPITITVQGDGSLLVNNARLVQADIPAANGAIHLIDQVLLPPAAGGATP